MIDRGSCSGNTQGGRGYKWIIDDVLGLPDELQRPEYILSLGARRLDRLLTEHPQHDAVGVAVALIRLIGTATADGAIEEIYHGVAYGNELIAHLISMVEHLAEMNPDALIPLVNHVRSDSFSLLFTTEERDHDACEAVITILGECLDATASTLGQDVNVEYTSTYLFSVVERHLDRSRDHYLSMALPMWEWSLNFGDGVTPRNNVKDLLQWAGERAEGDHCASARDKLRALREAVDQPFTQHVGLGSSVVEKGEFLDWLRELRDRDSFYDLTRQHPMFSVHALSQLFSLCQEYNMEWALASFDWGTAVEEDVERWEKGKAAQIPLVG